MEGAKIMFGRCMGMLGISLAKEQLGVFAQTKTT